MAKPNHACGFSRRFSGRPFGWVSARALLAVFATLSPGPAALADDYMLAEEPRKLALVISNSDYRHLADVPSASRDRAEVETSLRALGFQVFSHADVRDYRQFEDDVLPEFRREIREGDFILFYYSGHGFSHGPHTMLAYADQPLTLDEDRVAVEALPVEALEDLLARRNPGMLLFILDACRNIGSFVIQRPDGTNTVKKGLSAPAAAPPHAINMMMSYATRPGATAEGSANASDMSIFTKALVSHLGTPDVSYTDLFRDVMNDVLQATANRQQPGLHIYSTTEPYLSPSSAIAEQEREAWRSAMASGDAGKVRRFLRLNSVSLYASAARRWLLDNPEGIPTVTVSSVSPAAVERAWFPSAGGEEMVVAELQGPLAFEPAVTMETASELAPLSPADIGVAFGNSNPPDALGVPNRPNFDRAIETFARSDQLVATSEIVAHSAPQFDADEVIIAPETRLASPRRSYSRKTSRPRLVLASDPPAPIRNEGHVWIPVTDGLGNQAYVPLGAGDVTEAPVGRALLQAMVGPRPGGLPVLVDGAALEKAVQDAKAAGTIARVSLATAATSDPLEAERRLARIENARLLLGETGIDPAAITSLEGAVDHSGDAIRLRFFGY